MTFINYLIILFLSILPLIFKFNFWFFVVQLKEYRIDRFCEYLGTKQGKKAIFNPLFFLEIGVIILGILLFFSEKIYYFLFLGFLILENLFFIYKIIKKQFFLTKITFRFLLTFLILLILFLGFGIFLFNLENKLIYFYLFLNLSFSFIFIFLSIFLSLGIVNYLKNKKYKQASLKTKSLENIIKIGITGSFGKSSVKEFLSQILEKEKNILKTPKNINTEVGVSNIILNKLNKKFDYFVAEMGAYRIGEIKTLGEIVNHKYGFLTAIGNQHLGLFGSLENTKKAKSEISLKVLENSGKLYVNWDNENIRNTDFPKDLQLVKYGLNSEAEAKSKILEIKNGITKFEFNYKKNTYNFSTNLIGKHNIINISGVLAFCLDMGFKPQKLEKYLLSMQNPENTLEITKDKNFTKINDSYNLSQEGLFAGLEVLNSFSSSKILVLDDILELGKEAENIHFEIGKKIGQENLAQKILFVGINYKKSFINGLMAGGFKKENLLKDLKDLEKGSVILFEGRNSGKYI